MHSRHALRTVLSLPLVTSNPKTSLPRGVCFAVSPTPVADSSTEALKEVGKFAAGPCKDCNGTGTLAAGGYHKKNPLNVSKLLGTKWTARETVLGWRHFVVTEKRKSKVAEYALLVATCDSDAKIWMNVQNLRDRTAWACGWLQKVELAALDGPPVTVCKTCRGSGLARGYLRL